jgi:hypothetical protein
MLLIDGLVNKDASTTTAGETERERARERERERERDLEELIRKGRINNSCAWRPSFFSSLSLPL